MFMRWRCKKKATARFTGKATAQCNELRNDGIIKLDKSYRNFSDYLLEQYLNNPRFQYAVVDTSDPSNGTRIGYDMSLADPQITEFVLDPLIMEVLRCYYGTEPFLRNDPLLQGIDTNDTTLELGNGAFHIDRYNQLSLMLLLGETSVRSTHMEYLRGTHRRKFGFWNLYLRDPDIQDVTRSTGAPELFKVVGSKGDAFLFDTMGIHRANYILGSNRLIFHLNFTNGHNLYKYSNEFSVDPDLEYADTLARQKRNLVFVKGDRHTYFDSKVFDLGRW